MMPRIVLFLSVAALVGCSRSAFDAPQATTEQVAATVFNLDGAPTVQFSVPDMMCETSCAAKTKEILSNVPGVRDVVVDFPTKTATVAIDEGQFDSQKAIAELVDHGFDHSALALSIEKAVPETAKELSTSKPQPAPAR
jgi:copper chaperone CopZ